MDNFYNKYVALCAKANKAPSAVAEEIGLSRTAPHGWKRGRLPKDTTIVKLANYFGISVSYFSKELAEKIAYTPTENQVVNAENVEKIFSSASDQQKMVWAARLISSLSENQRDELFQQITFKK